MAKGGIPLVPFFYFYFAVCSEAGEGTLWGSRADKKDTHLLITVS